jgi:hypothetical protein
MGMDGRIAPPSPPPTVCSPLATRDLVHGRRNPLHLLVPASFEQEVAFGSYSPRLKMEPCQVCSALPPLADAGPSLLAERVGRLAFGR